MARAANDPAVLVICPNPAIDRHIFIDELVPGGVLRSRATASFLGGKAINMVRAMAALDAHPELLVLLPGEGQDCRQRLAEEGIESETVAVAGEPRETIIIHEEGGRTTVLNAQGATVAADDWQRFLDAVADRLHPGDWVVSGGSFPPGVDADQVRALVNLAHARGARIALDTGPSWLAAALPAHPDLITPNLAEATATLTGAPVVESVSVGQEALDQAEAAARTLRARGAGIVVVTAGAAGVAWAEADGSGRLPALTVSVASPVGAGDAFLGGLLATWLRGESLDSALRWGTATAAAAVTQLTAGKVEPELVRELRAKL